MLVAQLVFVALESGKEKHSRILHSSEGEA